MNSGGFFWLRNEILVVKYCSLTAFQPPCPPWLSPCCSCHSALAKKKNLGTNTWAFLRPLCSAPLNISSCIIPKPSTSRHSIYNAPNFHTQPYPIAKIKGKTVKSQKNKRYTDQRQNGKIPKKQTIHGFTGICFQQIQRLLLRHSPTSPNPEQSNLQEFVIEVNDLVI